MSNGFREFIEPIVTEYGIKPENILIDDNYNAYLIDFGSSQFVSSEEKFINIGSLMYRDYDLLYKQSEKTLKFTFDQKVDIWSLGLVFLEMDSAELPFSFEKPDNVSTFDWTWDKILMVDVINKQLPVLLEKTTPTIKHMLEKNPTNRFTIDDVIWLLDN
jgi:serine/threonine protein kinase